MHIRQTLAAAAATFFLASAAHAMGPLDADGDGSLTEEEFAPIAEMGADFAAYDSDGDGALSQEEFNEGVRALANDDDTGGGGSLDEDELKKLDEITAMFSNEVDDQTVLDLFN